MNTEEIRNLATKVSELLLSYDEEMQDLGYSMLDSAGINILREGRPDISFRFKRFLDLSRESLSTYLKLVSRADEIHIENGLLLWRMSSKE